MRVIQTTPPNDTNEVLAYHNVTVPFITYEVTNSHGDLTRRTPTKHTELR